MLNKLAPILFLVGLLAPLAALIAASVLYGRHRERVEPGHHVPVIAYIFALFVVGAVAGFVGLWIGVDLACDGPHADNFCGLWGFFVTGPLSFAAAVVLVGIGVSSVRPMPAADRAKPD